MFDDGYSGPFIPELDGTHCDTWAFFEAGRFTRFNDGADDELRDILEKEFKKWGFMSK